MTDQHHKFFEISGSHNILLQQIIGAKSFRILWWIFTICASILMLAILVFWLESYQRYDVIAFHYPSQSSNNAYHHREWRCVSYRGGLELSSIWYLNKLSGSSLPIGQSTFEFIREPTRDDGDTTTFRAGGFGGTDLGGRFLDGYMVQFPYWIFGLIVMVLLAILAMLRKVERRIMLKNHCRCGYCLSGNISGVCPECGEKIGGMKRGRS